MPETLSAAALRRNTIETMEEELRISGKQAADFVESLCASVEEAIADGQRVSLFGLVTITPRFVASKPKGMRMNPFVGEMQMMDAKPASVTASAKVAKRVKDALPSATSAAGKSLRAEAAARKEAADERREAREKEAAKAERAAARGNKVPAKKKTAKR